MKTIFLNKAIISYVQFIRRLVSSGGAKDSKKFAEYKKFLQIYRESKQDKESMASVQMTSVGFVSLTLVKIYYANMLRVWAFVQLLVEYESKREHFVNFLSYTNADFDLLEETLKRLWFCNPHDYSLDYVYLEDEENKVDSDVKLRNSCVALERSKNILEETQKIAKSVFMDFPLSDKERQKFEQEEA